MGGQSLVPGVQMVNVVQMAPVSAAQGGADAPSTGQVRQMGSREILTHGPAPIAGQRSVITPFISPQNTHKAQAGGTG